MSEGHSWHNPGHESDGQPLSGSPTRPDTYYVLTPQRGTGRDLTEVSAADIEAARAAKEQPLSALPGAVAGIIGNGLYDAVFGTATEINFRVSTGLADVVFGDWDPSAQNRENAGRFTAADGWGDGTDPGSL